MSSFSKVSQMFLDEQFDVIVDFLKEIHPFLLEGTHVKACIELRPIPRDKQDFALSKSLNLWDLGQRSQLRLFQFLHQHLDSRSCLYYSVYAFDYDKNAYTRQGKRSMKGKITSDNALFTQEIVLDFDDIDEKEQRKIAHAFSEIDLYGTWIYSGHGYQVHILLDEIVTNHDLLKEMVALFRSKGFLCDASCIDPARIMRLPGTHNYKCDVDERYFNEKESPPLTRIISESKQRYLLDDIKDKLASIKEDTSTHEETVVETLEDPIETKKKATKSFSAQEDSIALHKIDYPFVDKYTIPEPINKMLNYTPLGFRNKVLGFLIKYFKEYLRLGKNQLEEILSTWAQEACVPSYPSKQFKDDFTRLYYLNGLLYDGDLAKQFGIIEFDNQIQIKKQDIYISNAVLKQMDVLEGNEVRAYLGVKLMEHIDKEITIDSLAETLELTTRGLRPALKKLIAKNHVYVVKGNRRKKEPNKYFSTKIISISDGYLKLSFNDVKSYLTELGIGELKFYLFLRYKFWYGDCFMAQKNIGAHIGVTQHAVSTITKSLESKMFIRIIKTPLAQTRTGTFIYSCTYHLLR